MAQHRRRAQEHARLGHRPLRAVQARQVGPPPLLARRRDRRHRERHPARRGGVGGRAPRQPPRLLCQALPPAAQARWTRASRCAARRAARRAQPTAPCRPAPTRPPPPPSSGARLLLVVHRQLRVGGGHARFGLVYIDYATQRRVAKTSAAFFARLAQTNSFTLTPSECNATTSVTSRFQAEAAELTADVRAQRHEPLGPQRHAEQRDGGAGASGSAEGGGLVPTTMKRGGAGDADGAVRAARRDAGAATPSRASSS